MNQNDILTAFCTAELRLRTSLQRHADHTRLYSCPAAVPRSSGEARIALRGESSEMGRQLLIAAPGLPALFKSPLPEGFLRGGIALTAR
jgi:hypothetical protein